MYIYIYIYMYKGYLRECSYVCVPSGIFCYTTFSRIATRTLPSWLPSESSSSAAPKMKGWKHGHYNCTRETRKLLNPPLLNPPL